MPLGRFRARLLVLALAGGAAWADAACGLAVSEARPRLVGGVVVVDVRLTEPLSERTRANLDTGMPVTLLLTADLWRERSHWFDRLSATGTALLRIRYDRWTERYRVEGDLDDPLELASARALAELLAGRLRVPIAQARTLDPDHRYYVAVSAYVRPLTLEGLRDVEELIAQRPEMRAPSLGTLTTLPRALFDLLAALSGFEDEVATERTGLFRVPRRPTRPAFPFR